MKISHRLIALALTAIMITGVLVAPLTAGASEEGKRNTALGLGAAALALLLTQKNKLPGVLVAGGAAYAYSRYAADIRDRHRREREYDYSPAPDHYRRYRVGENDGRDGQDNHGYHRR